MVCKILNRSLTQGYAKGPLGPNGFGPLSVGLIFDKVLDL